MNVRLTNNNVRVKPGPRIERVLTVCNSYALANGDLIKQFVK
jgi:hypothetical protein